MGWLSGWSYRKLVTIPASSATTNYKVKLSIAFSDLNSHGNVDFSDVRFTLSDGSTLLKYDRKTYVASTSATFYFKDTDNIGAGTTAFMYYGKASATDGSDPANTYTFYDPATADLSANYTERNIQEVAQHQTFVFNTDHYRINSAVTSDAEMWEIAGISGAGYEIQADYRIFTVTGHNTQFGVCARYVSAAGVYYVRDIEANSASVKQLSADKEPTPPHAVTNLATGAVANYKIAGTWYSFLGRMAGSTLYGETSVAGETVTGTDVTWSTGTWGLYAFCDAGFPIDFRNVYVREYVANDPVPTLGTEQVHIAPTTTFSFSGVNANLLMGSDSSMEYSLDGGSTWTTCTTNTDLTSVLTSITSTNGIQVRVAPDGDIQTIAISAGPAAPVTTFAWTGTNQYLLMGSDSTMEYSFDNGRTFTTCTTNTDLSSLLWYITQSYGIKVRLKGVNQTLWGTAQQILTRGYPMRYRISNIEDQIIDTLRADTTNFSGFMIDTFVGQVSPQMFMNPEYMQGFIKILPFVLISYQGRVGAKSDRDSSGKVYIHTLTFRLFTGTQSPRSSQEAQRAAYDALAAIYDDLHGKVPVSTPQMLPGYTPLSGTAITTSEFNPLGPLYETGGSDEAVVVNLPGIVTYRSDFSIRLVA